MMPLFKWRPDYPRFRISYWIFGFLFVSIATFVYISGRNRNPLIKNSACLTELWSKSTCGLVTAADGHRLGNQMCVYASLYAIAKHTNKVAFHSEKILNVVTDTFSNLSIPTCPVSLEQIRGSFNSLRPGLGNAFHPGLLKLPCRSSTVLIENLLNSFKYYKDFEAEIKEEFRFKKPILDQCQHVIRDAARRAGVSDNCNFVGVHVRRGEWVPQSVLGHLPARLLYLHNAIDHMRKLFNGQCILFIVVGNDHKWNYENLALVPNLTVPEQGSAAVDMCILANCNHTIMSTGSFGAWGGFLAGGHVIYQKEFAVKDSLVEREVIRDDVFRPHWIGL